MKLSKLILIGLSLSSGSFSYANGNDAVTIASDTYIQNLAYHEHVVSNEETDISKEYATALALDGLRRVYETGLDFVGTDANSRVREIESVKAAIQCAYQHALIPNNGPYWNDVYVTCVTNTKQVTGDLNTDKIRTDAFDYKKSTNFYKPYGSMSFSYTSVVPGPLVLIYWAMERIGRVGLKLDEKSKKAFLSDVKTIISLIDEREAIGKITYIAEMESAMKSIQKLLDTCAKSKTNKDTGILNLINLRLTQEGAAKLGQVAFEEANRAYASKMMEQQKAKALGLFAVKHALISFLVDVQASADLRDYLDEVIQSFDELYAKYKSLDSKAPIRLAAKRNAAVKALSAYYMNDMHGFSNVKVEAAPLKDAFKIGRVLLETASTAEYNAEQRAKNRQEESAKRFEEYKKYATPTNTIPQIESAEAKPNEPVTIPREDL